MHKCEGARACRSSILAKKKTFANAERFGQISRLVIKEVFPNLESAHTRIGP